MVTITQDLVAGRPVRSSAVTHLRTRRDLHRLHTPADTLSSESHREGKCQSTRGLSLPARKTPHPIQTSTADGNGNKNWFSPSRAMDPYEACGPVLLPTPRFRTNNTTHISPFNSSPHASASFPVEEQEQQEQQPPSTIHHLPSHS